MVKGHSKILSKTKSELYQSLVIDVNGKGQLFKRNFFSEYTNTSGAAACSTDPPCSRAFHPTPDIVTHSARSTATPGRVAIGSGSHRDEKAASPMMRLRQFHGCTDPNAPRGSQALAGGGRASPGACHFPRQADSARAEPVGHAFTGQAASVSHDTDQFDT